jgi:tetrahydromethanopterin S-methyltransferase subunit C
MSSAEGLQSTSLVDRARAILMKPKETWPVIEAEKTDIATLYRNYVVPLAAIGPVATAIGSALIGTSSPLVGTVRTPIANAIAGAIVSFALALLGTYIVAQVIDQLAPRFSGTRNLTQAFKVSAYSSTAQWVAGIFALIPALGALSILGVYSVYLLYLGLPVLMKVPQEKATSYTLAVVVVSIVVFIVIAILTGIVLGTAAVATL